MKSLHRIRCLLIAAFTIANLSQAAEIELNVDLTLNTSCRVDAHCDEWGDNLSSYDQELFPIVPQRIVRVLLPAGETVESFDFEPVVGETMNFTPQIALRNKPISLPRDPRHNLPRYRGGVYPKNWMEGPFIQTFRGYQVAQFVVYPMRMMNRNQAQTITSANLTVKTKATRDGTTMMRGLKRDAIEARFRIENPDAIDANSLRDEAPGYLILGPKALVGTSEDTALKPLIDEKVSRGLNVYLENLEDAGVQKNTVKIREFITKMYKERGIDYVLLVGDHSNLPWKTLSSGGGTMGEPIPSDNYYSCLDGTFSSTATYDWACELGVGRVGAATREHVAAWVAKAVALQNLANEHKITKALNFGERMDGSTLAGPSLDLLINGSTQTTPTTGFPKSVPVHKIDDTFSTSVSKSAFIQKIVNESHSIVNHLGHAGSTMVFKMGTSDIASFPAQPLFMYTQGCYPNNPDTTNWTILATRMAEKGPAAVISNTRYGWYQPGGNNGPSNVLHRLFWSVQFKDGIRTLGQMNARAKELAVTAGRSSIIKYVALESNLIGDPELDLGLPSTVVGDSSYEF